jgi:trehalose-phosphatase
VDPPSALARWPEIERRLGAAGPGGTAAPPRLALFLDYDGTLTPIVARPELATLEPAVRDLLRRLAARWPVAVVSGRGREDVAALVGLPELVYAGSHGFDIAGSGGLRHQVGEEVVAAIAEAAATLARRLASFSGVLVEPKRFAVAVHYRLAREADLPAIEAVVDEVLPAHPGLRKAASKKVWELRPDIAWHKGEALRWLLAVWGLDGAHGLPLVIGDDVTDEDAFREAAGRGVAVLVAEEPRPTAASYRLRDPQEVREFLERIAGLPT